MIPGALAVGLVLVIGVSATDATINACQAGKILCVKSYLSRLIRCHTDAERSGAALDPACIERADDRYTGGATPEKGCFARLEAQRVCSTIGDAEALRAMTGDFVIELVLALDPTYPVPVRNTCSGGKEECASRLAASLIGTHARADKTGHLDEGRLRRAENRYTGGATPEKGCFAKQEARDGCLTTGDSTSIHDLVATHVGAVVCALDPSAGTCPPPGCGFNGYPACGGSCDPDLNLVCTAVSFLDGNGCTCLPSGCPTGTALMMGLGGRVECVPVPTCFEPSVTYPECAGNVPAGMVCQAIAAHSAGFDGCVPVEATHPCGDTCSQDAGSLGACPPGYACYGDPIYLLGPCGCFPPSTRCCQGTVPSAMVSVCADMPSDTAATRCAALSSTLGTVGGSASLVASGNVCDGSGVCTGVRTTVSACCQESSGCAEGTGTAFASGCVSLGGVLDAAQLCTPAGTCAP